MSSSQRWKRFFTEAGLPSEPCENYAVIFSENRIRFDMLDELTKDILSDMGIRKMGDVISILRHAKEVHSSTYRQKVFARAADDEEMDTDDVVVAPSSRSKATVKADSTIQTDSSRIITTTSASERRIVLPKRATNTGGAASAVGNGQQTVRRVAPLREPIIIRNITGLNDTPTPVFPIHQTVSRKRVFAPEEEFQIEQQQQQQQAMLNKMSKTDLIHTNPLVRNRIDAQSRLSNFSKEIHKVISSNQSLKVPIMLNNDPSSQQDQSSSSKSNIKSRLTMKNKADSTTRTLLVNRTPNSALKPERKDVKSRLGGTAGGGVRKATNVKDRLGRKSVLERISLDNNSRSNSSVFSRLGNR